MATTEVTLAQFRRFVEAANYQMGNDEWKKPHLDQGEDYPVVHVSWYDAVAFCNWLSEYEGREYRLPTEAEWEYCCRAGKTGTLYCSGNGEEELEKHGWYKANAGDRTHRVATKKPSAWGLYDMHGNASEWCQDRYDSTYYPNSPVQNPSGGAGEERVVRGGSWDTFPDFCRSAYRHSFPPGLRFRDLGFRVVLVPSSLEREKKSGR
jgi:formylglycine-generating enzyme required for sulfatase activity